MFLKLFSFLLSPTYFYADYRKEKYRQNKKTVTKLLKKFNLRYLIASIIIAFGVTNFDIQSLYTTEYRTVAFAGALFIIWIYPFSRANEVFYSFLKDAIEKVNNKENKSTLAYGDRIHLALKSYLELIINFAVIYYLLPKEFFDCQIKNIFDSIYFSGVTITTLGYGDISPKHALPQLLSIYEVLCGFSLIIVSFTVYVGKSMEQEIPNKKINKDT